MMFRCGYGGGLAAIVIAASVALGTAAPASAYTREDPAMPVAVCNWQGHFGASTWNPFSAYSSYCYDLSIPLGISIAGSLDVQGYCSAKFTGSKAIVVANNPLGWVCQRNL
jgi:hypothetical protein